MSSTFRIHSVCFIRTTKFGVLVVWVGTQRLATCPREPGNVLLKILLCMSHTFIEYVQLTPDNLNPR